MSSVWDPQVCERSAVYEPLRAVAAPLARATWPTLDELQRVLAARPVPVVSGSGVPLTFVAPRAKSRAFEDRYEPRVYRRGELQVRTENWHDLFNALVWMTFPRSKAALNARHFHALEAQHAAGAPNRGPAQDALTLFDEGGIVVAATDRDLIGQLRAFAWRELFWHNRARVESEMRFYAFGHALYEKMLAPFRGITAHALLMEVDRGFIALQLDQQLASVDAMVARCVRDPGEFCSTRGLAPVPVLGVPGWHEPNGSAAFYDDRDYFRSGRGGRPEG